MKKQPLSFYMHDEKAAFRFKLAGVLDDDGARQLEQIWRTASSIIGERKLIIEMTGLSGAEKKGRDLIIRWHREGAQLVAKSKASRALAESIIGAPIDGLESNRTWLSALFRS